MGSEYKRMVVPDFWTGATRYNQTHFQQAIGTMPDVDYIYRNFTDLGKLLSFFYISELLL